MAAPAAVGFDTSDPTTFNVAVAVTNLPPAPPGIRVQPPHIDGTLDVIAICSGTGPPCHIPRTLERYKNEFEFFLSPIQQVWQCGEFIRIALVNDRCVVAGDIASVLLKAAVTPPMYQSELRILFPSRTYYTIIEDILDEPSDLQLLLFGLYLPLCPDPTDSLALFQSIVVAVAPAMQDKSWFHRVVCALQGQLYVPFENKEAEGAKRNWTWWHYARRADTYNKLAWLMGPQSPLVFNIGPEMSATDVYVTQQAIWTFKLYLADIPSLGYQLLVVDNFLRNAKRAALICFYTRDIVERPPMHESIYRRVSDHLDVHAPETVRLSGVDIIPLTQTVIVEVITQAFAGAGYDHNITLLIMDYIRRDESIAAESFNPNSSTMTPYQQREAAYAIACKARVEHSRGKAQFAAPPLCADAEAPQSVVSTAAATHPRDEEGDGGEGEASKRQRI